MKQFYSVFFLVLVAHSLFSQSKPPYSSIDISKTSLLYSAISNATRHNSARGDSVRNGERKNGLFVQFLGEGTNNSLNYQHTFGQSKSKYYSYSVGFSFRGNNLYFPLSIDAFTKGKSHHLNMGVGVIPFIVNQTFKTKVDRDKRLFIIPKIGYKLQKANRGLFFLAYAGPRILIDPPSDGILGFTTKFTSPTIQIETGISF